MKGPEAAIAEKTSLRRETMFPIKLTEHVYVNPRSPFERRSHRPLALPVDAVTHRAISKEHLFARYTRRLLGG